MHCRPPLTSCRLQRAAENPYSQARTEDTEEHGLFQAVDSVLARITARTQLAPTAHGIVHAPPSRFPPCDCLEFLKSLKTVSNDGGCLCLALPGGPVYAGGSTVARGKREPLASTESGAPAAKLAKV